MFIDAHAMVFRLTNSLWALLRLKLGVLSWTCVYSYCNIAIGTWHENSCTCIRKVSPCLASKHHQQPQPSTNEWDGNISDESVMKPFQLSLQALCKTFYILHGPLEI